MCAETVYVGMDVHSKSTEYVIQSAAGEVVGAGSVKTDGAGLRQLVEKHQVAAGTQVALETCAQAPVVCDLLGAMGLRSVVVDAAEVRRKARRVGQKTDRRDAFEICDGLRRGIWDSIVYVPPVVIRRMRRVLSRRGHFVRVSTGQINAAKFLLRAEGLLVGEAVSLTRVAGWEKLLGRSEVESVVGYLRLHAAVWRLASEHIKRLEKELVEVLEPVREVVELLMSIPGVGLVTAATYVATLGTVDRFPSSNHVVSYLGLAPSMYDSGDVERHGHITKAGSSQLRALLCEVAQQAARSTHPLNPYFRRLAARSGYKKAAIAIAQRLARIMYRMWRNGERFDVAKLNIERDGRVKPKIVHWRIKADRVVVSA